MAQQVITVRSAAADAAGKSLGIAVFVLGIALLIAVFGLAYRDLVASTDGATLSQWIALPGAVFFKSGLFLIMFVVASAIANKGIALYQAARQPLEG